MKRPEGELGARQALIDWEERAAKDPDFRSGKWVDNLTRKRGMVVTDNDNGTISIEFLFDKAGG
jgi:hypothetical protein